MPPVAWNPAIANPSRPAALKRSILQRVRPDISRTGQDSDAEPVVRIDFVRLDCVLFLKRTSAVGSSRRIVAVTFERISLFIRLIHGFVF
jgi:hypothetical protein